MKSALKSVFSRTSQRKDVGHTYYNVRVSNSNFNEVEFFDPNDATWKPFNKKSLKRFYYDNLPDFNVIPAEIFFNIFSYLTVGQLVKSCSLVCKSWNYFACHELTWADRYTGKYGTDPSDLIKSHVSGDVPQTSWMRMYAYKTGLEQRWYKKRSCKHHSLSHADIVKKELGDDSFGVFYGYSAIKMNRVGADFNQIHLFAAVNKTIFQSTIDISRMDHKSSPVHTHNQMLSGHKSVIWALDYHPQRFGSNRLISGGHDSDILVWDLDTGNTQAVLDGCHNKGIWNLCILDQTTAISCGTDGLVKLFDISTGSNVPIQTYSEHATVAYDLTCSREGLSTNMLYSGSADKSVRVYDRRIPDKSVLSATNLRVIYELECSQVESSNTLVAASESGDVIFLDLRMMGATPDSAVEIWPLFNQTPIRGLKYNGTMLTVGSKKGTVIATRDPTVSIDVNSAYLKNMENVWVHEHHPTNLPFRVVHAFEDGPIASMQSDEEILITGTSSNVLNFYDFRPSQRKVK